jgi:hypothetical protein
MSIIKTIIEKVSAPMTDTDDLVPADNEALELAETELEATKAALESADADNSRLAAELRTAEDLIVYMFERHMPGGAGMLRDQAKEDAIADIVLRVNTRPTRPVFTRK